MTVTTTTTKVSYTGDGSTVAFAVSYPFQGTGSSAEITVVERTIATGVEVTKTNVTHYAVTGGDGSTGTVTAVTAPTSAVQWHIRRNTTQTQTTDYVTNDPFPADTHEGALDRLMMALIELQEELDRAAKFPETYTGGADPALPEPVAGAHVVFNADGDGFTTSATAAAQWLGGNGTASLPYYSFSADPNTGIYRIGADNLGISAGGSKIVDINASGMNGIIGATTPAAGSFSTLTASGTTTFTGVTTHGGNVVSDSDSTDDLGTTGVRWANLWVDDVTVTTDVAVGGNATVTGNTTITGNLTVNGTTSTIATTNTVVKDSLIELSNGTTGSPANDAGIVIERGSSANAFMGWDESEDGFAFCTTTMTGADTGNLDNQTDAQITAAGATFSGTSSDLGTVTTVDIDGGTVDGAVIGGASAAAITGTTLTGNTSLALATGATVTGIADEDDMSSDSAALLSTQQAIKAYVDTAIKAPGIQMAWEANTADADQGAGKIWANNAALASATVLYIDDVDAAGVSINAFVDTLDDPTATNSALIYIAEAGSGSAGVVYQVSGAVTSASTYSKIAVTHVATIGTLTDGDSVGMVIAYSGNDGAINNIVDDTSPQLGGFLDANGNYIQTQIGGDLTSANPLVVDTDGDYFDVTGTNSFSAMTVAADRQFTLQFDGVLTMTHHATNLDLPSEANITTAAGDVAVFQSTGANTVQCISYTKADGTAVVAGAGGGPGKGTAPSTFYRSNAKVQNENIVMSDHSTTFTATNATNVLNVGTDDDFANDTNVRLTTSGADLPDGWAIDTDYYVIGATSSTMQLAATVGGAAVTIADDGSGTHTVFEVINATAVGPITIKTGNSLTIPSGSRVVII